MAVLEQITSLTDERFLALYESLSDRGFGPLDGEVAKALKFRPQAIKKLPMAARAKRARSILTSRSQVEMCYEFLGTYLVQKRKDLVTGFLDATGVSHQEGMIEDIENAKPDPAKLADAVRELDGKHDPDDVTLYLAIAAEQWPDVPEVEELWRTR